MKLWLTMIAIGAATYAIRLSFIALLGQREIPDLLRRALRFVPPAVLSAIILPEMLFPGGMLNGSATGARIIAGMLAGVVAWRTKNVLLTIVVGMGALYLLQALHLFGSP
jgi:branched-subunit amino acid transport protein